MFEDGSNHIGGATLLCQKGARAGALLKATPGGQVVNY